MNLAIGYAAFAQRHRTPYRRYAASRLNSDTLGDLVAERVLDILSWQWPQVVGSESPAAEAWAVLRQEVMTALGLHSNCPDVLHRTLSAAAADAALLHYRLGMRLTEAGVLMGTPASSVAAHLLVAERALPPSIAASLTACHSHWP
ncbi:hypothetical protein ACFY2K_04045 [Kitasatospora sp. NPDC001309]|uniref:hypothetical protein n=1 Tax=Kitasatospora sp. NPDC001309 TaxID=3364013 RepID=UPI0036903691